MPSNEGERDKKCPWLGLKPGVESGGITRSGVVGKFPCVIWLLTGTVGVPGYRALSAILTPLSVVTRIS